MISRRSVLGGLFLAPAIVRRPSLMVMPRAPVILRVEYWVRSRFPVLGGRIYPLLKVTPAVYQSRYDDDLFGLGRAATLARQRGSTLIYRLVPPAEYLVGSAPDVVRLRSPAAADETFSIESVHLSLDDVFTRHQFRR